MLKMWRRGRENADRIIETIYPGIYKTKTLLNSMCVNDFYFVYFNQ